MDCFSFPPPFDPSDPFIIHHSFIHFFTSLIFIRSTHILYSDYWLHLWLIDRIEELIPSSLPRLRSGPSFFFLLCSTTSLPLIIQGRVLVPSPSPHSSGKTCDTRSKLFVTLPNSDTNRVFEFPNSWASSLGDSHRQNLLLSALHRSSPIIRVTLWHTGIRTSSGSRSGLELD